MKQHMMNRLMLLSFVIIATVGTIVGVGTQRVLAWMSPDDWGSVSNTFDLFRSLEQTKTTPGCCSNLQGVNDWGRVSNFETGGYWNQNCCGGEEYESGDFQIGWEHGAADAQYDHINSLAYNNDGGRCCHTSMYLDGFHKGYDTQWNIYQNTEQQQKSQPITT